MKVTLPLVAALAIAVRASFVDEASSLQPSLVVRDVAIVDVASGTLLEGRTVAVEGNRIVSISSRVATGPVRVQAGLVESPHAEVAAGAAVIDGAGMFLIPGLWDMHVHVLDEALVERAFAMLLANGVTGVRDMNGPMPLSEIRRLRASVASGEVLGPRFISPGPLLDGPGRGTDALGPRVRWVDTPQKARDSVRSLAAQGADFIKPYNRLTPELYAALMDEARIVGIPVMGHVPLSVDPFAASEAGQASMEHVQGVMEAASTAGGRLLESTRRYIEPTLEGKPPRVSEAPALIEARRAVVDSYDPALAARLYASFVRNRNWHCVTLVSNRVLHLIDLDDELRRDSRLRFVPQETRDGWAGASYSRAFGNPGEAFMRRRWERKKSLVGEMYRSGVRILAGSDTGAEYIYPGFSLHDELELLVEAGLSAAAALRAATLGPAEFLGAADSLGTVEPGKVADLVLLDANPLDEIANTKSITGVVANGRYLDRAALDSLLARAEVLAAEGR